MSCSIKNLNELAALNLKMSRNVFVIKLIQFNSIIRQVASRKTKSIWCEIGNTASACCVLLLFGFSKLPLN